MVRRHRVHRRPRPSTGAYGETDRDTDERGEGEPAADSLQDDNPSSQKAIFTRSHTFFIRAVDEQGLRSREPAYRSFTSRTISPEVRITVPRAELGITHFVDDKPDVIAAIEGVVAYRYLFKNWAATEAAVLRDLQAEAAPGVVAVYTAKDIPVNEYGLQWQDHPVLCGVGSAKVGADVVRFIGDQVAVVVARTETEAAVAVKLIRVDYEDLPIVTDPIEAMKREGPGIREPIAAALVKIGPDAVPLLMEALAHDDELVRARSVYALREMGPAAKAAVPALIEALQDDDAWVYDYAMKALIQLIHLAPEVEPALVNALKHKNSLVRERSVAALSQLPLPLSEQALVGLIARLKDALRRS